MFSFLGRAKSGGEPKELPYVLGLKFTARTRAEQRELETLEEVIKHTDLVDVVFDKSETGNADVSFWFHVADPKRAFKGLAEVPVIAERLNSLQAAYADRKKLKFSILWPRGVQSPHGLG